MAVFRVEKNSGYTVMSNHHLRNQELSLKAKGLLSQMLSLPDNWDYTLKGLSLINRVSGDGQGCFPYSLPAAGFSQIQCLLFRFRSHRRTPAAFRPSLPDW